MVLTLIALVTSGSAPSKALRDALAGPLRFVTEPLAGVGRGLATVGAVAADVQELRTRLALTIAERDEAVASASRVASLEREITELQAVLDLRSTIRFSSVAVQVVARDFEIGRRLVVIDRGARDGIQVGDVVIGAGNTLAGRVIAVSEGVMLPPGYFVEYGGQFEAQAEATRTLSVLSLLSVAAIFLLLYGEFGSARTAGLVMANLPLALIGGVVAVLLTGRVVSIASLVGFVTLFGIATRNGILLVAHYRQLLSEGVPFAEAITRGSLERLSPILMTALTAGLALIPLAFGGGEPGNELQTPMAIVILGGLISATGLNMIVLPALYWLYGARVVPAAEAAT